jgi:hypothetical protein
MYQALDHPASEAAGGARGVAARPDPVSVVRQLGARGRPDPVSVVRQLGARGRPDPVSVVRRARPPQPWW